jgi:putative transposase
MAHSYVKVFVHFVWTTKDREKLLIGAVRPSVKEHIEAYAASNEISVQALAVQPEHVHLLTSLSRTQRIEDIAKLLKGESSHWINSNDLLSGRFSWQTGYWGGSVSYQHTGPVKAYIEGQDEHHGKQSFAEEFEALLREYGYSDQEIGELLRLESH